MSNVKRKSLFKVVLLALFFAIMLVMNFTPIGYITTGLFSITLMVIPVALGAICLGKIGGIALGVLFGLTSFLQAFGVGYMIDPSASLLFNEDPFAYTLTCFIPRILAGFLAAVVFDLFKNRGKDGIISMGISAAIVPILNTTLFMTFYILLYRETVLAGTTFMTVFLSAITLNFVIELLVTILAGTSISKAVYSYLKKIR